MKHGWWTKSPLTIFHRKYAQFSISTDTLTLRALFLKERSETKSSALHLSLPGCFSNVTTMYVFFFLFQVKSACSNYIYKTFLLLCIWISLGPNMQPHGSARITLPVPIYFKAVRIWITFSRLWWQEFFTHETINMVLL